MTFFRYYFTSVPPSFMTKSYYLAIVSVCSLYNFDTKLIMVSRAFVLLDL